MRKLFFLLTFVGSGNLIAQNLVPNSSFEDTIVCPTPSLQISEELFHWFTGNECTPDVFNSCSGLAGVPINHAGNQNPVSGNGYVGIFTFDTFYPDANKDYLSCRLIDSLRKGKTYSVLFFASLADRPQYAIRTLGAAFSIDTLPVGGTNCGLISIIPQVEEADSIISDKTTWHLISGSFIANGGEQFITIGNFRPDSICDSLFVDGMSSWDFSYYYIDDVSVVCIDCTEGIEYNVLKNLMVFPNPTKDILNIEGLKGNETLLVFDLSGRKLIEFVNAPTTINVSGLAPGFYFAQFNHPSGIETIKFVKE